MTPLTLPISKDEELITAVRSVLSRMSRHPSAIEVDVHAGHVFLRGPVLAGEEAPIREALKSLRGVTTIEDRLSVLQNSENRTQNSTDQFGYRPEFLQRSWSPLVRAVLGGVGAWLGYQAFKRKGSLRLVILGPSVALLARAITNLELAKVLGAAINPVIRMHRTIRIFSPVEDVFEFLGDFSNYSRFMSYVSDVKINDRGGLKWKIVGPAGTTLEWDAVMTAMLPGQKVAWKSVPNAVIATEGSLYLRPTSSDWTTLEVDLMYAPPAGALGYAVGHFLGFDPAQKIDQDLRVLKSLIENR